MSRLKGAIGNDRKVFNNDIRLLTFETRQTFVELTIGELQVRSYPNPSGGNILLDVLNGLHRTTDVIGKLGEPAFECLCGKRLGGRGNAEILGRRLLLLGLFLQTGTPARMR